LDGLQNTITSRQNDLATAQNKINDNPWLDEASRTGRNQTVTTLANADIKNYQDEYNAKLKEVEDLVTRQSADNTAGTEANKAKLAALEDQAKALAAQATTQGAAPKTITGPDGTVYAWNGTSFDTLNLPGSSDSSIFNTPTTSGTPSGINTYGIKSTSTTQSYGGVPSTVTAADGGTFLASQGDAADRAVAQKLLTSGLYSNLTVDQALRQWSNNGYNASILQGKGVDPQAKIGDLTKGAPQQIQTILDAIKQQEGITNNNAAPTGSDGRPTVTMTANNVPDPTQQSQFLSAIKSPDLQTIVKGLADYTINPASLPTRNYKGVGGVTQAQAIALAQQYDPSYDSKQYSTRQATMKAFTSGQYSQNINSLNTAIGHISDILSNTKSLANSNIPAWNALANSVKSALGAGGVTRASTNLSAATSELASTFKGSGATDAEIKQLGTIDANSSPEQVQAYIETAAQLLASRLQALTDTYTSGMGKAPANSFLSPTSVAALQALQKAGLNIQVPGIGGNTPAVGATVSDASGVPDGATAQGDDGKTYVAQGGQWVAQ
jgi:hypothetical protein